MIAAVDRVTGDASAPAFHRFKSAGGDHVLAVPFSRVFDLSPADAERFDNEIQRDVFLDWISTPLRDEHPLEDVVAPAAQAISLNVSSSCNLSCSYCYAARGSFDGAQKNVMSWPVAQAAVDRLLETADPSRPITIGFLGGEPFANRPLIHRTVGYAARRAIESRLDVRFSVTTNGTLLRASDIELIRAHPFAVTVSVDGAALVQNKQRPRAGRKEHDSFAALVRATSPLLANPGTAHVGARATVTRSHLDLASHFDTILGLGFAEVGFSPLRLDPNGDEALKDSDWPEYLNTLKQIAHSELERARAGHSIRLSNLVVALRQIARGASSPYPCGAGGGYFSVSAEGRWYACHRAIGDKAYEMGTSVGLNEARRRDFLTKRHVHAQTDCRICWARYLCSGSCHQESKARSGAACDFIRGWLDFCLGAYCDLSTAPNESGAHP